jgi:hypothetical protein
MDAVTTSIKTSQYFYPYTVAPLLYLGADFYATLDPDTLNHVVAD